jgi:hypothetical protein
MKPILTILTQVIFEIFGDMFFMFPEHYEPEERVEFPSDWIRYRLKITESQTFFLNFYFTPQHATLMAENFLGENAGEISPTIIDDTLKEAVNVMGGNLLNRMGGDYRLGIPEKCITEDLAQLYEDYHGSYAILLNIENHPFLVTITREK